MTLTGAPNIDGGAATERAKEPLQRAEARIRDLEAALAVAELKLASFVDDAGSDPHARAALERSEQRFQRLISGLDIGVVVQGPQSEILLHNARALDLLGLSEDEIHGRSSFDPAWQVIREDGSPYLPQERPVAVALTTRAPVRGVVGITRPRRGDVVWLLVNAVPERDPSGEVVQVVATLDDISERKRLEDSLRQAQRLDSLGLLAGGIAHDFNNLLTVISNCTELARMRLPAACEAERELDEVLDATERATALTRQLLSFARRQMTAPHRVDASEAVVALEQLLARLLQGHHHLVIEPATSPTPVKVDQGQLEQVLVNLVVNARDAMPDGGEIRIRVRGLGPGLAPDELSDAAAIEIAVRDTGSGMTTEVRDRIFEPFFTTKPVGKGTGLGLATVHGIVRQAGGRIRVVSEPDRGSEFQVFLPEDNSVDLPDQRSAPLESRGQGQTILVVDDEPVLCAVIARMLDELGYRTRTASDGFEALDLIERGEAIDLLLTDVVMPRMGGVELAHRARERHAELRAILMSGYARVDSDAFPVVADTLLRKPFNRSELALAVRAVLGERPRALVE